MSNIFVELAHAPRASFDYLVATVVAPPSEEAASRASCEVLEASEESLRGVDVEERGAPSILDSSPDRPVWLRVWDHEMSPRMRWRLSQKLKIQAKRTKKLHWKTKKRLRRDKYQRVERDGKLRRDKWLKTTPEGLYLFYRILAKRKKADWLIAESDWLELMYSDYEGSPLYTRLFYIYRIDTSKAYTMDNISIVDRYDKSIVYYTTV